MVINFDNDPGRQNGDLFFHGKLIFKKNVLRRLSLRRNVKKVYDCNDANCTKNIKTFLSTVHRMLKVQQLRDSFFLTQTDTQGDAQSKIITIEVLALKHYYSGGISPVNTEIRVNGDFSSLLKMNYIQIQELSQLNLQIVL